MDAITAAVQRGGSDFAVTSHLVENGASAYAYHAANGSYSEGVQELLELVEQCPGSERLQVLTARLLDRSIGRADAITAWFGVRDRFPLCHEAVLLTLRWVRRTRGEDAARAELRRILPRSRRQDAMLLKARAWVEVGDQARASRWFMALSRAFPGFEAAIVHHASAVRPVDPWRAARIVDAGLQTSQSSSRLAALSAELATDIQDLAAVPKPRGLRRTGVSGMVLAHLLQRAGSGRDKPTPRMSTAVSILMVGATLGAGGAERQLANTAVGLQRARLDGRLIAGRRVEGSVRVCCRSLSDRPRGDFFLPLLQAHQIPVDLYQALPEFGGDRSRSVVSSCGALLRFLPAAAEASTIRLADEIRRIAPTIVHLWQDGTILACSLAALLAGVPRIVLGVRTAPPPDRPERDRPEYSALYPALLRLPGVTLVANSRFAAKRYANWIGVQESRVKVVPNGLMLPLPLGGVASQALLASFSSRTGRGFTVGSVMRLDANKRPQLWVDCAARFAYLIPQARFIIVGDGPLRSEMEAHAALLGLSGRFLFVGRTDEVGFWLTQMDAFLLLSHCEGLPNVVIEAQSMGVPVVATPAGGTAEALLDGLTGHVIASAEAPCVGEAAGLLARLAQDPAIRHRMASRARRFATESFSMDSMIERTVEVYDA